MNFLDTEYPTFLNIWLEWSGIFTFFVLGIWVALRFGLWLYDKISFNKKHIHFPISAQKLGFAQNIGNYSLIMSEMDYKLRQGYISLPRKIIKIWWPLIAWAAVGQFIALYGARGVGYELKIDFIYSLIITLSALGILGLYRKSMIKDHLRETSMPEGESLDWDSTAYIGGIRILARFEGRARKVILNRLEENVISKDGINTYSFKSIMSNPSAIHSHGTGVLISEFRLLNNPNETITEENWLQKIQLKDVLYSSLNGYVCGNSLQIPFACLLEYPGAVFLIYPMAEHIEYLESVAERLRTRKKLPVIAVRDVALAASQEFYTRFDEKKVASLLAHQTWIEREKMPI